MQASKNKAPFTVLFGVVMFVSLIARADEPEPNTQPSRFRFMNFGITERLTSQSVVQGLNLSTLLSWNPHYQAYPWLNIEGQLGATLMSSNQGNFIASRYQIGASFHNLFSSYFAGQDRIVPEVLVGMENWAVQHGGTYFVGSLNLHYQFHFKDAGILNFLDSVHVGYQWLPKIPSSIQQYVVGLRIVPFLEKPVEATPAPTPTQTSEPIPVPSPEPTPTPSLEPAPAKKTIEQFTGKLEGIQFVTNQSVILPVSYPVLDQVYEVLMKMPALKIRVEGHTDNVGKREKNLPLSEARAEAVVTYLTQKGIDASRLSAKGFGPDQPIGDNSTSEGRAKNRRVDFVIQGE